MEELAYLTSSIALFDEKIKLNFNFDICINRNKKEIKIFNELNRIKPCWYKLEVLCFFEKKSEKKNFSDWNYQQKHFI